MNWYNNQTKEVQEKFRNNCIKIGGESFFNRWISEKIGITTGIAGAFVFRYQSAWRQPTLDYRNDF